MDHLAPLRVIIVEDHISIRLDIEEFLEKQPAFVVIGACSTVHDAIVLLHTTKPHLLLLDINLPDGTGFDILEQLPAQTKVIFLTAYQEYAMQAIRYGAIDYLLKPINEIQLTEALQRVINSQPVQQDQIAITLHNYRKKTRDYIALKSQHCTQTVALKEIIYIQVDNGSTNVFLKDGNKVVTCKTLKDWEELLSGTYFMRTHQSYMVNESYIHRYQQKEGILHLKDGTQIPVSLRKKEMVDNYFKKL